MINWFLRAKHWQLFLLTFGIMVIGYIMIMYGVFLDVMSLTAAGQQPDPMIMFRYMKFLPILIAFTTLVMMGWNWSVAIGLQKKFSAGIVMKTNLFKIFVIVPAAYMVVFLFSMVMLFNWIFEMAARQESSNNVDFSSMLVFPFIIVPLHLFSLFCYFYNMYFVAKTIKTAELRRPTTFNDFLGEFFLIWFFPIGVWILQPRINSLYKNEFGSYVGTPGSDVLDESIRN